MDDGGYGEGVEAVDEHGPRGLDVRLRIVAVRQTTYPRPTSLYEGSWI